MLAKKNKGFTYIEVVVSIFILTIILTAVISTEIMTLNTTKSTALRDEALTTINGVSKVIQNNLSYEEIIGFSKEDKRYFYPRDLENYLRENIPFTNYCSLNDRGEYPVLFIKVRKDEIDNVVKMELVYKFNSNHKEDISYVFYKGKY